MQKETAKSIVFPALSGDLTVLYDLSSKEHDSKWQLLKLTL